MATRTTTKKAEPKTTTAKTAIEKEAPAKIPVETATVSAVKETMETTPVKKAAAAKKTSQRIMEHIMLSMETLQASLVYRRKKKAQET